MGDVDALINAIPYFPITVTVQVRYNNYGDKGSETLQHIHAFTHSHTFFTHAGTDTHRHTCARTRIRTQLVIYVLVNQVFQFKKKNFAFKFSNNFLEKKSKTREHGNYKYCIKTLHEDFKHERSRNRPKIGRGNSYFPPDIETFKIPGFEKGEFDRKWPRDQQLYSR